MESWARPTSSTRSTAAPTTCSSENAGRGPLRPRGRRPHASSTKDPSPARYEDALLAGVGVTMTAFALAALAGALLPARAARLADAPIPQAEARSEAA